MRQLEFLLGLLQFDLLGGEILFERLQGLFEVVDLVASNGDFLRR